MYLVYKHTSPSGKSYIGLTGDYNKRCGEHISSSKGKRVQCEAFHAAIRKYGWDNFLHEILYDNLTLHEANLREQQCINEYGSMVPAGYNLTSGGLVTQISEATRLKQSLCRIGKPLSESAKAKISAIRTGVPRSEETKAKIRAHNLANPRPPEEVARRIEAATKSKIGRPRSEETKAKLRLARVGKTTSLDTRDKIRKALTGRPRREETKAKIAAGQRRRHEKRAAEAALS